MKSSPSAKLKITLLYCGETLTGFTVVGHAGYAEYGSDIVCSAVSALTQAAAMGLTEYINALGELKIQEGEMRLTLKKGLSENETLQAKAILETMRLGLLGILKEYPGYIEIEVKTEEDSI